MTQPPPMPEGQNNPQQPQPPHEPAPNTSVETGQGNPEADQKAYQQQAYAQQASYQQAGQAPYAQAQPYTQTQGQANNGVNMMMVHLLALFTSFIGPLAMYFSYKDQATPEQLQEIKDCLNFQLTYTVVASVVLILTCGLGIIVIFPYQIFCLVFEIKNLIASNNGEPTHYPFKINFVK